MSQDREPSWQWPDDDAVGTGTAALASNLADLVVYCRTVTGRDEDADAAAHAILDSAQSLLTDPDQLRAWLFALARVEVLADSEPDAREILDLVHRHGIRPEDLPVVLGIPPAEADQMLAAAEAEYGVEDWDRHPGWDDSTHLIEPQPDQTPAGSPGAMLDAQLPNLLAYCSALTDGEEAAIGTAHSVLGTSRSLLTDPDRLRAWLFALARQELLADTAPGEQEVLDLVHQHGIRAEDLPTVLGIPQAEADQLLAVAEEEYASSAFSSWRPEADPDDGDGRPDDMSWDDRAAAWDDSAARDYGAGVDDDGDWEDSADWDQTFGPKRHGLHDLYAMLRKPPESAGRHAAPP